MQPGNSEGKMVVLEDLGQVAEDLRKRGIDAVHDFVYGERGCIEGLGVGDDFFPLWELCLADNAEALSQGDFALILKRRGPDWTADGRDRERIAAD